MKRFKEKLDSGSFVVTMEVDPPRGSDPWPVYDAVSEVVPLLDAVNIADCPTAKLRMSPIALSSLVQQHSHIAAIFHLTARDRNVMGLQAELLGAWAMDVRNILCVTGDAPRIGDHPNCKGVYEVDSVGMAELVAHHLNKGMDAMNQPLTNATGFCIGAVANPNAPNLEIEVGRIARKHAAGVCFFQTQPVYDMAQAKAFMEAVRHIPAKFLLGVMPVLSVKQANYLNEKVPGVRVPQEIIDIVEGEGKEGVFRYLNRFIRELHDVADGVHVFPMGQYDRAIALLE